MSDRNLASVCGLYCGTCEYFKKQCPGCGYIKGKPFWTTQMNVEVCPFYDCCINRKQIEHCGLCDEFPCRTFMELYDPSLSEEEAKKQVQERQEALLRRKEVGTERWLEEKEACEK
ncbi:TPA: hypothetical protein DCX15_01705 [bacterium]|nr:hypothetical protein [bacterium]